MSKIAKATVGLMIVTMISKVLGFSRELVLGAVYGASNYSDVYITAMNIPTTLFTLIGTALITTFMPLYFENHSIGGEEKANYFVSNIFNIIVVFSVVVALGGILFARPLVKIFAMGFEYQKFELAVKFTRIMIFGGIFVALSKLMTSYLNAKGSFKIPGLTGIPFNIIIIISIILSASINIYILPIGTLIAMASQFLFQCPFVIKKGYKYRPILDIKDESVKKMTYLLAPVFIGVAVNQVNSVVDKTLASTLVEGSISALNYANRLNSFVMAMFISSVASVVYPMLSKLSSENNKEKFTESVVKSVNSVILLVIPISVGAIVLATPIVELLFQRGAFDARATKMTAIALVFYSIGMVGFGLRDILGKVFYSLQDTKTPMVNGAIAIIMNIVLNVLLIKYMEHAGLAFATSISGIVCILLLFRSLKKRIGYYGEDKIIKSTIKSLIASIIMGVITWFVYECISNVVGLILSISVGVIVYGILIIIFKVEELNIIINFINKKVRKI